MTPLQRSLFYYLRQRDDIVIRKTVGFKDGNVICLLKKNESNKKWSRIENAFDLAGIDNNLELDIHDDSMMKCLGLEDCRINFNLEQEWLATLKDIQTNYLLYYKFTNDLSNCDILNSCKHSTIGATNTATMNTINEYNFPSEDEQNNDYINNDNNDDNINRNNNENNGICFKKFKSRSYSNSDNKYSRNNNENNNYNDNNNDNNKDNNNINNNNDNVNENNDNDNYNDNNDNNMYMQRL